MEGLVITLPTWFKWLLPIISPVLVAVLKAALPQLKAKLPAWAWPAVSAVLSAILAALGISFDPGTIGLAVVAGIAGSKVRDIATGKTGACYPV